MIRRPKICFAPVTMSLFWNLYPQLEEQTLYQQRKVKEKLEKDSEVLCLPLTGNVDQSAETALLAAKGDFDLLVIWENGYVASGIPLALIEACAGKPVAILVTQRDRTIPEDMDYARYMDSTATTSAMELGGVLARKHIFYKTFIGHVDDREPYQGIKRLAEAAKIRRELSGLVVGSIGYPYPGMLDICVDEAAVSELGVKVVKLPLSHIAGELDAVTESETDAMMSRVRAECDASRIGEADLRLTTRLYLALERIVAAKALGALCVHDYDCLSTVSKTVSDFALSYLENDHGLSTGVEGDMPNCISAFIARVLSGKSSMFVDWTMFDESTNSIFFQHNGKAAPEILVKPVLSPSAEPFGGVVGDGVVFEGVGKPGPVTMISLIYRSEGWVMFVAQGDAIQQAVKPCRLNQMTVTVKKPVKEFLREACDMGIGHHLNVAYGHFAPEAECLAHLLGIKFLTIRE